MAEFGFPFTSSDLRHMVKAYLDRKGVSNPRFKDNLPSHRWVDRFLERHPQLSLRPANPIKRSRAAVSREDIFTFIENWEKAIEG